MKVEHPVTFVNEGASGGHHALGPIEAEKDDRCREHLKTDHLLANLKGHTISGGAVTMLAQAAKFLLTLGSTMILARVLTPGDFGLVAMVTTVTSFLRVFKDAGLSTATVQRERITHAQVSNLFWINVGVSFLSGLLLAGSAWLIARFYHDLRLIPITLFLSRTFVVSGLAVQHQALLKRQMRFKALAAIEVGSMAVSVFVGVVMAMLGYRYWSLVGASLSMEIGGLLLTWSISRWRPELPTRHSGIGPLVSFGASQSTGGLIFALARGSDNLLLGRFYGADSVGLYSRASALLMRPLEQFLGPISAVFIPALSRLQSQPERYRSTFLRLYEAVALIGFPFTGISLALSRPLTLVLLGPKWEQATVIFGAFTIAALCAPLAIASTWLFTSQGRGRDMLVAQSINACVIVLSFIAGLPFGPVGVAIFFSISSPCLRLPILYYVVGRRGPVKTLDLWKGFLCHLPIWLVVFGVTWIARFWVKDSSAIMQLLICVPVGLFAATTTILSLSHLRKTAAGVLSVVLESLGPRKNPLTRSR